MRTCTKCGETKPLSEYHVDRGASEGRSRKCKECAKAKSRAWNSENRGRKKGTREAYHSNAENRSKKRLYDREWREKNLDRKRANDRRYCGENSEKAVERVRQWRAAKGGEINIIRRPEYARRRAKLRSAFPPWADREEIAKVYAQAERLSAETGIPHEVDHIIPLAGKNISGLHVHENLRAIPKSQNRRKSRKELSDEIAMVVAAQLEFIKEVENRRGYRLVIGEK